MENKNTPQEIYDSPKFFLPSKEEFFSVLREDEYVRNRIYNLRHGETEEIEFKKGYIPDKKGLVDGEKNKIKNNQGKKLMEYGLNSNNTSINYAGRTARIRETANALIELLDIKEGNIQNYVSELDTIPRNRENQLQGNNNLLDVAVKGGRFIEELLDVLKEGEEGKNIINVIHKTNFTGMDVAVNRSSGENIMLEIYGGIEENEMKEIDLSAGKESINYKERKDLLFLGDYNVNDIISLLAKDEDQIFKNAIMAYNNKNIQIYQLQNYINYMFRKNPELYEKYIASGNEDLMIFCIANLVKKGEYDVIYDKIEEIFDQGNDMVDEKVFEEMKLIYKGMQREGKEMREKLLKKINKKVYSIDNEHQSVSLKFLMKEYKGIVSEHSYKVLFHTLEINKKDIGGKFFFDILVELGETPHFDIKAIKRFINKYGDMVNDNESDYRLYNFLKCVCDSEQYQSRMDIINYLLDNFFDKIFHKEEKIGDMILHIISKERKDKNITKYMLEKYFQRIDENKEGCGIIDIIEKSYNCGERNALNIEYIMNNHTYKGYLDLSEMLLLNNINNDKITYLLLHHPDKININYQKDNQTLFMKILASQHPHPDYVIRSKTVDILRENYKDKIDISTKDNKNKSVFMYICENRHIELMRYCLENHLEKISETDRKKGIQIFFENVCFKGEIQDLEYIYDNFKGQIFDKIDENFIENTILKACRNGNIDILKKLISSFGVDVLTQNIGIIEKGLILAFERNSFNKKDILGSVKYLIEIFGKNIDINKKHHMDVPGKYKDNSATLLMYACQSKSVEDEHIRYICEYFHDTIDLNIKGTAGVYLDYGQETVIMQLCRNESNSSERKLFEYFKKKFGKKIDINIRDDRRHTAYTFTDRYIYEGRKENIRSIVEIFRDEIDQNFFEGFLKKGNRIYTSVGFDDIHKEFREELSKIYHKEST